MAARKIIEFKDDSGILMRVKAQLKRSLTNFSKAVEAYAAQARPLQRADERKLQEQVKANQSLLVDFQLVVTLLAPTPTIEPCQEEDEYELLFYDVHSKAQALLATCADQDTASSRASTPAPAAPASSQIHLPKIRIPMFSGRIEQWLAFKDVFESMVHKRCELSDLQKFHYLRGSLEGEAAAIIANISTTQANYAAAWDALCNRFDDKKRLVAQHLDELLALPAIGKESAQSLRQLVDGVNKNLHALRTLGETPDDWRTVLLHLICNKLDSKTRRDWESRRVEQPTVSDLLDHLLRLASLIEKVEASTPVSALVKSERATPPPGQGGKKASRTQQVYLTTRSPCVECQGDHLLFQCQKFQTASRDDRMAVVHKHRLCINCLRGGHRANRCTSKGRCQECKQRHHTRLHDCLPSSSMSHEEQPADKQCLPVFADAPAILPTARIRVKHGKHEMELRALLDSASQCSLITQRACDALRITPKSLNMGIRGVGGSAMRSASCARVTILSLAQCFSSVVTAHVVPNITSDVPCEPITRGQLQLPGDLALADPDFDSPAPIDMLLGTEHFWALLQPHSLLLNPSGARLQRTVLGWVVCGPNRSLRMSNQPAKELRSFAITAQSLDKQVQRFWEQEEVPSVNRSGLTPEQEHCELLFATATTRTPEGRFVVRLPHSPDVSSAPAADTCEAAQRRLLYLERRLRKQPQQHAEYAAFLREYEELGHMRKLTSAERDRFSFYLPHHAVLKAESTTTKLRVVFDGSSKMSNGKSLNSYQYNGICPQRNLVFVLLSFRLHRYAATADIAKMYRQILVHPDDRFLQRIVWRHTDGVPVQHYELQTLTYGTKSAAFLATRCLHEVGELCEDAELRRIIQNDFYVDDLLTGHDDAALLKRNCERLTDELKKFGLPLRKWRANTHMVPHDADDSPQVLTPTQPGTALGVVWYNHDDSLAFKCDFRDVDTSRLTRRAALSVIAQIYDPLGLLAPVTIVAKQYMQQLWTADCGWDDTLPQERRDQFAALHKDLLRLEDVRVPRHASQANATRQLHIFCDASQKAFGAAAYLRSASADGVQCHLLCAKTRVAPLKALTIPRLELCAALMGAKLAAAVKAHVQVTDSDITYWSDSTIVLAWIATPTYMLQTYESNRVGQINDISAPSQWRHVESAANPADTCSRGTDVTSLIQSSLWWHGPTWLSEPLEQWPAPTIAKPSSLLPAVRCMVAQQAPPPVIDFTRFSTFNRILNVVMYTRRFINNASVSRLQHARRSGAFTADERAEARRTLIRIAQAESYAAEIKELTRGGALPASSRLYRLSPYLDDGVMRIRGRLQNAEMDFDELHPAVVSAKHALARMWFEEIHRRRLHCGPTMLIAESRRYIWVPRARDLARKVVHACIPCWRENPRRMQPIMGNLPTVRSTPSPPFSCVGIDCAGPLDVSSSHLRGTRAYKSYIVVFVCLVTKAIHLELVSDMSTIAFLAAFRRFSARRGMPHSVYSDNGRNFVGAAKELLTVIRQFNRDTEAPADLHACQWHFIPPYAPNFGGLWEAAVRLTKHHLRRTLKGHLLSYEEMTTLLCQIEGILNSRPLSQLSDDPSDVDFLTPAHFLIGRNLLAVPDRPQDLHANVRLRFRRIQSLQAQFWDRWSRDYLRSLHVRTRWAKGDPQGDLRRGELVIIEEPGLPPRQWALGRVADVSPGADGVVRVATLTTSRGAITRPVRRLSRLPIYDGDPAGRASTPAAGGSMSRDTDPAS